MKMKAEIYKPRDAKAWQQTTRSLAIGMEGSLSALRRHNLCQYLNLGLPTSGTLRQHLFIVSATRAVSL